MKDCPETKCPKLDKAAENVPWEVANIVIINTCNKCKEDKGGNDGKIITG